MNKPALALLLALFASPAFADTLIHNVNGIQVGADGKLEAFGAIHIRDDGRVQAIYRRGSPTGVPRKVKTVIDGGGRTLLPGLIDAHGHVMGLGTSALQLDLVGTTSLADLQERLRRYAAENPGGGWILGRGWNQELWPDKRFPTAANLDAVVADRPVWLERVDGHANVGNSAAMRAAGISAATRDPSGGRIERDSAGRPTGLFIDTAAALVESKVPPPSAADQERALAKAQELLLASGLTAVADMGTSLDAWRLMRKAGEQGRLNVRIMSYASGIEPLRTITRPTGWLYGDRLRMGGIKLYGDGALGSRGAWLKAPYADAATSGLAVTSPADLRTLSRRAASAGFQVAIHAIGDRANAEVMTIFEELARAHGGDRRWRIEHVQVVDPADIPRLARAGIIASMQPIHQVSDRTMAEARLGPNRLTGAYAWNSIARAGARLAFGSDFPVEPTNPFLGLSAAVSRQDPQGVPPGGWLPHERVSFAHALSGFTRDAAYAGFAEGRIGSLEPGKWADFILVDRDVSNVDPQSLAQTKVLETWVAGRQVWGQPASGRGERGR
ncbi:MAG TPA: amidohydrolase [Sphingomicrobium sp.]|nr:amidohydrolase [Sphingomicrobium sp.]